MISYKFRLTIKGAFIDGPVSFSEISERFRNINMCPTEEGYLEISVTKRDTIPMELSIKEAKIEANEFVDRLSLLDNHYIAAMQYSGYAGSDNILVHPEFKRTKKAILTGIISDPVKYYSQENVKNIINGTNHSSALRIYRTALGINDKISQYLVFYGVLLILKGEKQKEVDKYIKAEIPDILMVNGNNGVETIITRVRNMIAHPIKDLDMTELNIMAGDYLIELRNLVLRLLKT